MSFIFQRPEILGRGDPRLVPSFAWDFTRSSSLPRGMTFTRASAKARLSPSGLLESLASDVAALDYNSAGAPLGLLIEEARTNVVLWNRDLTNAAWTASNVTVAKTATGIDGVANSASTLTATAGNGTVLQAITLASSARSQPAWVKRRTGTGTINMTMDNGSTWTAIVPTASWSRLSIPTQTLANPTVGFRIVTNGDAIDIDYVQNENGTFATSSIATTTASVTRAADVCSILTSAFPFNAATGTIVVKAAGVDTTSAASAACIVSFDDASTNNRLQLRKATLNRESGLVVSGGVVQAGINSSSDAWLGTTRQTLALAYAVNDVAVYAQGAVVGTQSTATMPTGITTVTLGSGQGCVALNGTIGSLSYFPRRLSNNELQARTA